MRRKQNILALLQTESLMNIARFDLRKIIMQHLRHRRSGHIGAFLRQTALRKIAARVLAVCQIDVRDNIDDSAVSLLRQALILTAVARLHVEDRDVQTLRADHGKTRIGIAEHQHGIRLDLNHQLIALRDDIAHCFAKIRADRIKVNIRILQRQIFEKYTVEIVIVVLPRMSKDGIKILPCLIDHRSQPDDLRPRPHNDQ